MNKRGLGRGLGALLSASPSEGDNLLEVSVDQIAPNPQQPRKAFDQASIDELASSPAVALQRLVYSSAACLGSGSVRSFARSPISAYCASRAVICSQ